MTKFVKCIDNTDCGEYLSLNDCYKVINESTKQYNIFDDNNFSCWVSKTMFEEVKQEETTTNKFRFIPKTEITEVTVDGIEGVLIEE